MTEKLTEVEKMIWTAAFAVAVDTRGSGGRAAEYAWASVRLFRGIDVATVEPGQAKEMLSALRAGKGEE